MEHVIMMHAKDNIAIVMAPSLAVGSEFTVGGKMVCAKDNHSSQLFTSKLASFST